MRPPVHLTAGLPLGRKFLFFVMRMRMMRRLKSKVKIKNEK